VAYKKGENLPTYHYAREYYRPWANILGTQTEVNNVMDGNSAQKGVFI